MAEIANFMGQDHDRLDGVMKSFSGALAKDIKAAASLFEVFKTGLERHIVWEEEILFPIFEEKTGMKESGPTAMMRSEHQTIKKYLNEINDRLSAGDNGVELKRQELLKVLSEHNAKEESILYPWIDETLNDEEREDILQRLRT